VIDKRQGGRSIGGALVVWFLIVLAAGASGRVAMLHPPMPQLILVALTLTLIVLERSVPTLRTLIDGLDPRSLVAIHLTRFVGIVFLIDARRGVLPDAFALPAGWGDITVATLAVLLLTTGDATSPGRRKWFLIWNGLGLLDLMAVVVNAARIAMANPPSMKAMLHPPLNLLPHFLVPILLASHVWLFRRLRAPLPPASA
jgi:hypothetical protein